MYRYTLPLTVAALALLLAPAATAQCAPPPTPEKSYEDSAAGLKELVTDAVALARADDEQALALLARALVLPPGSSWFTDTFGEQGERMQEDYESKRQAIPAQVFRIFRTVAEENLTDIEVRRHEDPCRLEVHERQYPLLIARVRETPLYEVRATKAGKGHSIWFFAWVDGAFRYIGMPAVSLSPRRAAPPATGEESQQPTRIRVGGQVQSARLIKQERPRYPERARRAGLQGTVRLAAVITRDGEVGQIRVIQGHCWLAEAAVRAVSQWRYQPTLLRGEPVEVVTTIDVVFQLQR